MAFGISVDANCTAMWIHTQLHARIPLHRIIIRNYAID